MALLKMINTWFTSDTHFGHKKILEYEKEARPFSCLEEMHEVMIERWNSVVKRNDVVYHLGDFCFGQRWLSIADVLNGKKRLIMGNHDIYPTYLYLNYFEKLHGVIFWKRCVLSHMPIHTNGLGARWFLNVHGHLHSKVVMLPGAKFKHHEEFIFLHNEVDKNYFNVSCEQNNLTPIHADVIMERIEQIDKL